MCDDGDALNTVDVNVDLVVRPNLQDCYTLIHLGELENLVVKICQCCHLRWFYASKGDTNAFFAKLNDLTILSAKINMSFYLLLIIWQFDTEIQIGKVGNTEFCWCLEIVKKIASAQWCTRLLEHLLHWLLPSDDEFLAANDFSLQKDELFYFENNVSNSQGINLSTAGSCNTLGGQ